MIDPYPGFRCLHQGEPFGGATDAINTRHTDELFGEKNMELMIDLSNLVSSFREVLVEMFW